jgi:hypothetical protein
MLNANLQVRITFDVCSLFCRLFLICRGALLRVTGASVQATQHLRLEEHISYLRLYEEDE